MQGLQEMDTQDLSLLSSLHNFSPLDAKRESLEAQFASLFDMPQAFSFSSSSSAFSAISSTLYWKTSDEIIVSPDISPSILSYLDQMSFSSLFVDGNSEGTLSISTLQKVLTKDCRGIVLPASSVSSELARFLMIKKIPLIIDMSSFKSMKRDFSFSFSFLFFDCKESSIFPYGEMGLVMTQQASYKNAIINLREKSRSFGVHAPVDAMQARIFLWQMSHQKDWHAHREKVLATYKGLLKGLAQVSLEGSLLRVEKKEALLRFLEERGYVFKGLYTDLFAISEQMERNYWKAQLPHSQKQEGRFIILPMDLHFDFSQIDVICRHIHAFYREKKKAFSISWA